MIASGRWLPSLFLLAGCFDPTHAADLACSPSGACPAELHCEAVTHTCQSSDVPAVAIIEVLAWPDTLEALVPAPPLEARLLDAQGRLVPISGGSFELGLLGGRGAGLVDPPLGRAERGLIKLDGLRVDRPGRDLRVELRAGGLSGRSTPFSVRPTRPMVYDLQAADSLEGCATLTYKVRQSQGIAVDLLVEVDPDGDGPAGFQRATQAASAPGEAGVQGVQASDGGRKQRFAWASSFDVPADVHTRVRLTPSVEGVAGEPALAEVTLQNGLRFERRDLAASPGAAVAIGDLDRDGWPDVVSASGSQVRIELGHAGGVQTVDAEVEIRDLQVADLDGDGRRDVVLATQAGLRWLRQTPIGELVAVDEPIDAQPGRQLLVVDANRDGADDLVVVDDAGKVRLFARLPAEPGRFAAGVVVWNGGFTGHVSLAEITGDAWPDLLVGRSSGAPVSLVNLGGPFAEGTALADVVGPELGAADLNRDGHVDLISLASSGLRVHFGGPNFIPPLLRADIVGERLVLAEVDGDGLVDALISHGDEVLLYAHVADPRLGDFQPARPLAELAGAGRPLLVDLDRDGRGDLLLAGAEHLAVFTGVRPRRCGAGLGGPRASGTPLQTAEYRSLGDLNLDGKLDVVSVRWGVWVDFGRGDGTFEASPSLMDADGQVRNQRVVDMDLDGAPDVLYAVGDSDTVTVLWNDPAAPGQLTLGQVPTLVYPEDFDVADVDGDGVRDLLVIGSSQVRLLRGDPELPREFLPGVTLANQLVINSQQCGFGHCQARIVDLDGDGLAEIVVVAADQLVLYRRDPAQAGQFLPPTLTERWNATISTIGDLVGDARPEVLLGSELGSGERIIEAFGLSAGGLAPVWSARLRANQYPYRGVVADLNGDGGLELAIGLGTESYVGSPETVPELGLLPVDRPALLAGLVDAADVDGDGRMDLVGVDAQTRVAVAGTARSQGRLDTGTLLGSLGTGAVAARFDDVDGDGLLDVAALDANGVGVSIGLQSSLHAGELEATQLHLPGSASIALADLDGNRRADVLTFGTQGNLIFMSEASGFSPRCPARTDVAPFAVGDVDRDGALDLVLPGDFDEVMLWRAPSLGCDQIARAVSLYELESGWPAVSTELADMNRDGRLDIVSVTGAVIVALQTSVPGVFAEGVRYESRDFLAEAPFNDGAVGDLDRDGWPDVVVVGNPFAPVLPGVGLLRGSGAGQLGDLVEVVTGQDLGPYPAVGVELVDVDEDGWLDLVVSLRYGGALIFRQEVDGSFVLLHGTAAIGDTAIGSRGRVVDFDADGRLDLVTSDAELGTVLLRGR